MSSTYLIIMIVLMVALMYFMVMRPQKKQMERQREMLNQVGEGTRVMLTSGLFGTIRATGETQAVVELAPGVDVTILRQAISKVVKSEDEEFEFADEAEPAVEDGAEPEPAADEGAATGAEPDAGESARPDESDEPTDEPSDAQETPEAAGAVAETADPNRN
ncbi:preprotein translocase subunit YajC [uncultured Propionibacterium sp.]|uniref:preprotein translocase subunit YajC n=1 Tax=uncultured Propionibacterium sp. TaxID=218066 RepID=UPI00292D4B75|nr:preprotein translocase subunit YajC [uncultured Propionibacterium sp.]